MKKCPHCGGELTSKPEKEPDGFSHWWAICTRKVGRGQAIRAYATALNKTTPEVLRTAYRRYCLSRAGQDPQFTVNPATWLNGERWLEWMPEEAGSIPAMIVPVSWSGWGEKLAARIGEARFVTWFGESELAMLPTPTITVKSAFIQSYLTKNFGKDIFSVIGPFDIKVKQ